MPSPAAVTPEAGLQRHDGAWSTTSTVSRPPRPWRKLPPVGPTAFWACNPSPTHARPVGFLLVRRQTILMAIVAVPDLQDATTEDWSMR